MPQDTVLRTAMLDGTEVDIAPLDTVDFSRIVTKDPAEIAKLFMASQTHGFFYLDLRTDTTSQILEDVQGVLSVMKRFFAQDLMTKMQEYRASPKHGYLMAITHFQFQIRILMFSQLQAGGNVYRSQ